MADCCEWLQGLAFQTFRLMYPHIGSLIGLFRLCGYCSEPQAVPAFLPSIVPQMHTAYMLFRSRLYLQPQGLWV